jgi:ADP-heptose:LPS heptosyltransferase/glycosyltransferase involved in cell wall biosynthesis
MTSRPLVSCIMPTYNRRAFVRQAIRYFQRQDYEPKELIIVDDGADAVADLMPDDGRVNYVRVGQRMSVGAKRNLACEQSRGEFIAHWDDDDWHAPHRLRYQVEALLREGTDLCGIRQLLFFEAATRRAWRYVYPSRQRLWLSGSTLCYRRDFWAQHPFGNINVGEDARFVWNGRADRVTVLPDETFHVGMIHPHNISPKQTGGTYWQPLRVEEVRELLGQDWSFYTGDELESATAAAQPQQQAAASLRREAAAPTALISAAYGIGDILRVSPLVRVFAQLGYEVDVLVAPDYPEILTLLKDAPEIRQLFHYENLRSNKGRQPVPGLGGKVYDVAAFTVWSLPLRRWVRAKRTFEFPQAQWLSEGDSACVEKVAREVGWKGALPEPLAIPSQKKFELPPGTIALHPGCKPDWPWKKWHGFEELARMIPNVAIIGTPSDLHNENTYFRKEFEWPEHARNFVGSLSLQDTAALLRECAALISNDSGMMHLGVAVGTPTFGIFGITNPEREAIPSQKMFPLSKGLQCEAACRKDGWGRRDCEHHLTCLKSLAAEEVLERVRAQLPALFVEAASRPAPLTTTNTITAAAAENISLIYYGYVFDASGYGQAARAYIHALHRAQIKLSVVELKPHQREVRDELVESLVGKFSTADFHLFHGIPTQWARTASSLHNAIGMTVWETDAMPAQWHSTLSQCLDVWLPCDYNVSVFHQALGKNIFKLPHPLMRAEINADTVEAEPRFGLSTSDFLFYSIFEWQDRKSPQVLIESYLRAFPVESETVLIIKANPSAARLARTAVEIARRRTGSRARLEIFCETWNESRIESLHRRGDCYVSLHCGEGWGYPLFEAASRGTPVIATQYSGPLEYLNAEEHLLVQYRMSPVHQAYHYYHPKMRWAEPDAEHATRLMRQVFDEREAVRARSTRAARRIREKYSLENIGEQARRRLSQLLEQASPRTAMHMRACHRTRQLNPPIPIPARWYDEDYFENGLKSNWERGYSWHIFADTFRRTATFLTTVFAEAETFLDIGCAKGFLVQALRELGKDCHGFDHSHWAISGVNESVRPYVTEVGVDAARFDRQFDMLLAFNIFESLTESQLVSFLTRARAWTRQALFAAIPSFENEEEERLCRKNDGDLSHITMKSRQWWHEMFRRTGWRQDHLHRIVERLCQNQELPTVMKWKVYVYAP